MNKKRNKVQQLITQFIKFGIVGVSNTVISYVIYLALVYIGIHYLIGSIAGFVVSVLNSYYWNSRFVFEKEEGEVRIWWKVLLKTYASYAFTGLLLNNIILAFIIEVLHVPVYAGPLITLIVTIPLNFVLNKLWAFRGSK